LYPVSTKVWSSAGCGYTVFSPTLSPSIRLRANSFSFNIEWCPSKKVGYNTFLDCTFCIPSFQPLHCLLSSYASSKIKPLCTFHLFHSLHLLFDC
jgi:hypothetical protein